MFILIIIHYTYVYLTIFQSNASPAAATPKKVAAPPVAAPKLVTGPESRGETRVKMTRMRLRISQRLKEVIMLRIFHLCVLICF